MKGFLEAARKLELSHEPFVVVTMISVRGSAPQNPGAKLIVTREGYHFGTVGGGKIESHCIRYAQDLLTKPVDVPDLKTWNLQRDIGMSCGGEGTYLFETHRNDEWRVVLYGAGHVAQALTRTMSLLKVRLTCIDFRPEWVERLPEQENLTRRCAPDLAATVPEFDSHTFFLSMTQGHAFDVPVLEAIFRNFPDAPLIGVIGSDVKSLKIRAELKARGIPAEDVAKLRCPVGLPFGSNDPSEIAISIAAELLQERDRLKISDIKACSGTERKPSDRASPESPAQEAHSPLQTAPL